ncbi:MAG: hypothetical protein NZM35_07100, partial [Chitinophagales bacterium]|nr:hypothetical protein [Chitinophagales bacterium]MDW8420054.1 hypothetical protein [Chitinophagales bacterium]
YNKVTIKGNVQIENYQQKEVVIDVKKFVNGFVNSVSDGGKSTKLNTYNLNNPRTEIKWEVKVSAGQKKSITYEYDVYFQP